jgi:hypothetical protein
LITLIRFDLPQIGFKTHTSSSDEKKAFSTQGISGKEKHSQKKEHQI